MFKIDGIDAAATEPTRPAAGSLKFFSDALRTTVSGWWLNMVQNEIASAVTKFGLTLDKSNDNQLGLAIQAGIDAATTVAKADRETVTLTSVTANISSAGNSTTPVTIANLVGTGLVHADIRGLWVTARSGTNRSDYSQVRVTLPDGSTYVDLSDGFGGTGNDGAEIVQRNTLHFIPIDKGQTTVNLYLLTTANVYAEWKIIAASQRVV